MKTWLLLRLFIFCFIYSFAQKKDQHANTISYHHIFYSGLQLNNNGFGVNFVRGFHKTIKKKKLYELALTTLKHPREVKVISSDGSSGFVFGKKNSVYNLRFGKGQHNVLAYKPFGEGVELKFIYATGIVTTFLKPIYYFITYGDNQTVSLEQFDEKRHNEYNIRQTGPFFKGFYDIVVQPGIFGKFALNFEYATQRSSLRSLELGAFIDGYYKNVEILAFAKNYSIIVSLYLSLQFGKKWYR
jgi:hypothetical protein